jgi:hypothetical protein
MAFRPAKKSPQFSDLVTVLAQSKSIDDALYQTVQEIINRLDVFANTIQSGTQGERGATGAPGPIQPLTETFVTSNTEPTLVNHRRLTAGANVTLDSSIAGELKIHSAGGGGGATLLESFITHVNEPTLVNHKKLVAGSNIMLDATVPNELQISTGITTYPHAPTHSQGGSDPVDIKNLAGYPGGTTQFLRADKTFAVPPGGSGGGMNLDYLGDYVPATYNDGDIVIGADGIAYMCVVDGTVTPPEPWPGIGLAVNATVDASYWVVSAHPQLVNERVMSSLANGYVKSTVGEPSTVAIIPIVDGGTGANNATQARTNLGVGSVGTLNLNSDPTTYLSGDGVWRSIPGTIVSGMMVLSTIPCPPGWTRVGNFGEDGKYLRIWNGWGDGGGTDTHAHGAGTLTAPAHTHSSGSYVVASHDHGTVSISGTAASAGSHQHDYGGSVSGTTGSENNGTMNCDAGASGLMARGSHEHNFSANYAGTTNSGGSHSHSVTGSGATGSTAPSVNGTSGSGGGATVTGASAAASHLPPTWNTIVCYKD